MAWLVLMWVVPRIVSCSPNGPVESTPPPLRIRQLSPTLFKSIRSAIGVDEHLFASCFRCASEIARACFVGLTRSQSGTVMRGLNGQENGSARLFRGRKRRVHVLFRESKVLPGVSSVEVVLKAWCNFSRSCE